MKAQHIQRQLKVNALLLTELQKVYLGMRHQRKSYNAAADTFSTQALAYDDALDFDRSAEAQQTAEDYRDTAVGFTPYIKKMRRKIASLEEVQKALKDELKCQQHLEAWCQEDDAFWLEQARIAQEEGYTSQPAIDDLLMIFGPDVE